MAALGDFAVQHLGSVQRWINTAGPVTDKRLLTDFDAAGIAQLVGASVLGSLLCCGCVEDLSKLEITTVGSGPIIFTVYDTISGDDQNVESHRVLRALDPMSQTLLMDSGP